MNGPCMCGDPYCGQCGDPGRAATEDAEAERVFLATGPDFTGQAHCSCGHPVLDSPDAGPTIVLERICIACWAEDHPDLRGDIGPDCEPY